MYKFLFIFFFIFTNNLYSFDIEFKKFKSKATSESQKKLLDKLYKDAIKVNKNFFYNNSFDLKNLTFAKYNYTCVDSYNENNVLFTNLVNRDFNIESFVFSILELKTKNNLFYVLDQYNKKRVLENPISLYKNGSMEFVYNISDQIILKLSFNKNPIGIEPSPFDKFEKIYLTVDKYSLGKTRSNFFFKKLEEFNKNKHSLEDFYIFASKLKLATLNELKNISFFDKKNYVCRSLYIF